MADNDTNHTLNQFARTMGVNSADDLEPLVRRMCIDALDGKLEVGHNVDNEVTLNILSDPQLTNPKILRDFMIAWATGMQTVHNMFGQEKTKGAVVTYVFVGKLRSRSGKETLSAGINIDSVPTLEITHGLVKMFQKLVEEGKSFDDTSYGILTTLTPEGSMIVLGAEAVYNGFRRLKATNTDVNDAFFSAGDFFASSNPGPDDIFSLPNLGGLGDRLTPPPVSDIPPITISGEMPILGPTPVDQIFKEQIVPHVLETHGLGKYRGKGK